LETHQRRHAQAVSVPFGRDRDKDECMQIVAQAALFVACKVEERLRPLDHIAREGWKLRILQYNNVSPDRQHQAIRRYHEDEVQYLCHSL
jgi:hypothetical protein